MAIKPVIVTISRAGTAMAKMRRKADLPTKACAACGRPFAWRKKWAKDWEQVKYCSDACRTGAYLRARTNDAG
ncbi:MAG: DUF2256 domain-containing protein [Sandarakinorhabdus sp.]